MTLREIKKYKLQNKKINHLERCPQKRGIVGKLLLLTPRKPNSAKRSSIQTKLSSFITIFAYIPGIGHNLKKHSTVLISGRGARDLPNVSYRCIRHKYDLLGVLNRKSRKSIYGVKILK